MSWVVYPGRRVTSNSPGPSGTSIEDNARWKMRRLSTTPARSALASAASAAASAGTFPTHGPLFVGLLIGVILILGGLQYFPALALGPIVEHVLMNAGKAF